MKIIRLVADRKPSECMLCPLLNGQSNRLNCGEIIAKSNEGGFKGRNRVPDERCLITIEEK